MATNSSAERMNNILAPVLFQVIGSTPESIADSIKKANIEGNTSIGTSLASIAVMSSAVNKSTMETFVSRPELAEVRPIVMSHFTIGGRTNMTGLTLLGHCLLTSNVMNDVKFAQEFRRKMGQNNIWEGNLDSGSLSAKQKEIILEKKRLTSSDSARLLGVGFFKYVGIDDNPMTASEARFWGVNISAKARSKSIADVPAPSINQGSPPRNAAVNITLKDGNTVSVNRKAYNYYMGVNNGDLEALKDSIRRRGIDDFNKSYSAIADSDPNMKGISGNTVVG